MEAALNLYKEMINNKIPLDLQIYTSLIGGFLKEGKLNFAIDLYSDMLSRGIVLDMFMYTVLINGLCNNGQLENAGKILKEMDGNNITPSVLLYNTLIAGHFKEGNLQEAFRLHDEMLDKGLVPDDTTYDILVNGKLKRSYAPVKAFLRGEPLLFTAGKLEGIAAVVNENVRTVGFQASAWISVGTQIGDEVIGKVVEAHPRDDIIFLKEVVKE
ncbi:pentatricopeptide repeat-containing protein At2g39230, mitochondrial-like [Cajanus cajan]|uniref:pentatricopeptide repeat-containing protein At2g39230, mitochondrial-like n=1 Tax=Cajanus cajan TaxID=3821 RepID=UPI0010FB3843|nr:pentatricopeptide repeat-containing protein At2g39230, mitochondrial-like [Cajanus cajan]